MENPPMELGFVGFWEGERATRRKIASGAIRDGEEARGSPRGESERERAGQEDGEGGKRESRIRIDPPQMRTRLVSH